MMRKPLTPEEETPQKMTVTLPSHIIRDLKDMERNTKQPIDSLVTTALKMFIATHHDFLGKRKMT